MNAEPLISVVLPTYNRARTLPRAIRSVLAQSHRNLELLVVDDVSTDDSERVVGEIAASDPRVRFVRRERNGGPAAARNSGLALARGDYIAFQDSDDEWLIDKLERQLAALQAAGDGCALCVCSYLVHRESTEVRGYFLGGLNMATPGDLQRQALVNFFFPTPSWLARTAVLRSLGGFDEQLRCWEDWELAIRISRDHAMTLVDHALYIQHVSQGSVNRQDAVYGPVLHRILEKHADRWAGEPRVLAEHLYVIARHEVRYGDPAAARPIFLQAARLAPRFWKAWTAWLWVLLAPGTFEGVNALRRRVKGEYRAEKSTVLDYIARTHGSKLSRDRKAPTGS